MIHVGPHNAKWQISNNGGFDFFKSVDAKGLPDPRKGPSPRGGSYIALITALLQLEPHSCAFETYRSEQRRHAGHKVSYVMSYSPTEENCAPYYSSLLITLIGSGGSVRNGCKKRAYATEECNWKF